MLSVKKMRKLVLTNFNRIFDLSTGFCTIPYWNSVIETNCFAIFHDIFYNIQYSDPKFINFYFDFDQINFLLLEKFKHFSLFSICLHFLRCIKSCDKQPNYCWVCSRITGGYFYNCNFFSNMCTGKVGANLGFYYNINVDLDVFLYNASDILGGWTTSNSWCSCHQNFGYALELFQDFCSVFVRIYLNLTITCFEDILCRVALIDKNKILTQILKHTDTNTKIFHELLIYLIN